MKSSDRAAFKRHGRRNYTMYKRAKAGGNRRKAAFHAANARKSRQKGGFSSFKALFR